MPAQPPRPVAPDPALPDLGAVRQIFRVLLMAQASIILAGIAFLLLH